MATLMLTSLGSALGGPLGAAIGGLVGQTVDRSLFGAGPRIGPRLGDLAVQTSSYGSMVPRIYGKMRVAGTVIWATDLKEGAELQSGGKGQADALTYSYSVSLAVALSSRPLRAIRRIWADGQLLRGAAGDSKVQTRFRFYPGDEDQGIDPTIAACEGLQNTPAYRGLAVVVFEDLQLAAFGNRIPVMTFEVEGDGEPPTADAILKDASGGCIDAGERSTIEGYAAYGQSIGDACGPLIENYNLDLHGDGAKLIGPSLGGPIDLPELELGCSSDGGRSPRIERTQRSASDLPNSLSVTFYDATRDYQAGEQHAAKGARVANRRQLELPAVLAPGAAKSLAEAKLARLWVERDQLKLRLPPGRLELAPGTCVRLAGQPGQWRVKRIVVEGLVVSADLVRQSGTQRAATADGGRSRVAQDQVAEPTIVALVEVPRSSAEGGLQLQLAASGGQTPWRPVPVRLSGPAMEGVVSTARTRAVLGTALQALGANGTALLDLTHAVEVELAHQDDWLQSCDDEALVAGTNLALIGNEILQFGEAIALGSRRFRLKRLLRGRGGTEWATSLHKPGEAFVLLDQAALTRVDLPPSARNTTILATAAGIADNGTTSAQRTITGESVRPLSPAHLQATLAVEGSVAATWVRRSRVGWTWMDEVDVPLDEATERYRVRLAGAEGTLERMVSRPVCTFSGTETAAVGRGPVRLAVAQVGDTAVSAETQVLMDTSNGG